jgi:hypothetical protein
VGVWLGWESFPDSVFGLTVRTSKRTAATLVLASRLCCQLTACYGCWCPQVGQNLASAGIVAWQFGHTFVACAGDAWLWEAGGWAMVSRMDWAIA